MKPETGQALSERSASSLDPADWDAFRSLAHRTLDRALDYLVDARRRPVWQPVPEAVKRELSAQVPLEGRGAEAAIDDVCRLVLPYATGNVHPAFCGWVHGGGTAGAVLAEILATAMNANLGGREHAPVYVERQVIGWFKNIFGFPPGASGLLTTGTSMATWTALAVARNASADWDVRRQGLSEGRARFTCYASRQAHGSVTKAVELLGLGSDSLRLVPVDSEFRISLPDLRTAIEADRAAGYRPFCVVGTAGTVNTGAIDNLKALSALCREYRLWFHVDGAFGALAVLVPELRHRLAGIEHANSLAFDFHKWLQVPYDAGCLLVREEKQHLAAFSGGQRHLRMGQRGLAAGAPWFCEYGPELSRGFRALKVWMTIQEHGLGRLGEIISQHCRIAEATAARVQREPELELLAPPSLNIVCFRYADRSLPIAALDAVNLDIVETLQEEGLAAPSTCEINGALAIRACFCNHRSTQADADRLLKEILRLGRTARNARRVALGV